MEVRWHRFTFPCNQCERETTLLGIAASSDGEILVDAMCILCGKEIQFKTDIRKILTTCCELDIMFPLEEQLCEPDEPETPD